MPVSGANLGCAVHILGTKFLFRSFWTTGRGIIYCEDCAYNIFYPSWRVDPIENYLVEKDEARCCSCERKSPADFPVKYTREKFYNKTTRSKIFES